MFWPNVPTDKKSLAEHKKSETEKEYHNGKINMAVRDEQQTLSRNRNRTKIYFNFLINTHRNSKNTLTISKLASRLRTENGVVINAGILFCNLTVVSKSSCVNRFLWTK